jgi:hypothetical protein
MHLTDGLKKRQGRRTKPDSLDLVEVDLVADAVAKFVRFRRV